MAKNKNKSNKWVISGIILAILGLIGYAIYISTKKPKGIGVKAEKVMRHTIHETVSGSGKIFPETEIKISSDVSGEIVDLYVEEGDSVKTGQLLAKIDPEAYFSAVERGEAMLNNVKMQLANAQANIESSIAQKEQILAQIENAKTIYQRNKSLLEDGVISRVDYEQSETALKQLQANLRAAEARIKSAKKSAEAVKYQVKSAEASLKELKTNLHRTYIKAPTSGIVSSLSVEKGERVVGTIQMAGTEMMRIANLSAMEVQVEISENDILRVSLGDTVNIDVDAYPDKPFKGVVTEIANSAANISGFNNALSQDKVTNFIVKVRINPQSYLSLKSQSKYPFRPGMSASVDIFTEVAPDVISVPIQAVTVRDINHLDDDQSDDEEDNTMTKKEDLKEVVFLISGDTTIMQQVTTGIQDDEYIEILEGLKEGQEVITGPYAAVSKKLKPGKAVFKKKKKKK